MSAFAPSIIIIILILRSDSAMNNNNKKKSFHKSQSRLINSCDFNEYLDLLFVMNLPSATFLLIVFSFRPNQWLLLDSMWMVKWIKQQAGSTGFKFQSCPSINRFQSTKIEFDIYKHTERRTQNADPIIINYYYRFKIKNKKQSPKLKQR